MNVSTQLLEYNALAVCTYSLTNKCDNYLWDSNCFCYYGNKVIHNICNMAIHDLPDMYALSPSAFKLRAYISGKFPIPMLQPLHVIL